jgi:CubicO group peptidase (beta-lactamase class C family)
VKVLQAAEAGRLSIDDLATTWVDPILHTLYNHRLVDLFGANATRVTIRDLLAMSSGFNDYIDDNMKFITIIRAGDDIDPILYLRSAAKNGNVCAPGTCKFYSGANYVLLGYVLVQLEGLFQWQDLDQSSVIPAGLRSRYQHTSFLKLGRCAQYHNIAHQFSSVNDEALRPHHRPHFPPFGPHPVRPPPHPQHANVTMADLSYASCLNGWTMGNIASSGQDMATFFYDLFAPGDGGGFLNSTTQALMTDYGDMPLSNDWCPGCQYGMGIMQHVEGQDVWPLKDPSADANKTLLVGHLGADWGSGAYPCGYQKELGFGVCFAFNSLQGMNCSMTNTSFSAVWETTCLGYDSVLAINGGPRLNCEIPENQEPTPGAVCEWLSGDPENRLPHPPRSNHLGPPPGLPAAPTAMSDHHGRANLGALFV